MRNLVAVLAALIPLAGMCLPCRAQDSMDFAPEDVGSAEPSSSPTETFAPEDVSKTPQEVSPAEEPLREAEVLGGEGAAVLPRLVALVIRSGDAEEEKAFRLTQALVGVIRRLNVAEVLDAEEFRARLLAPGEKAALDCSTNAVCLSGYGKELWIDKILLGVLYKGDEGYRLHVDLVGVENAEVEGYVNPEIKGDLSGDEIEGVLHLITSRLFRVGNLAPGSLEEGPRKRVVAMRGPVQTGLAYATAGLAVVAAGVGVAFGVAMRDIDTRLRQEENLTQREAQRLIADGDSRELHANLMFAASGVSLVASACLFLIKPLQEVEERPRPVTPGLRSEAIPGQGPSPILVVPGFGPGGPSVTAGFRF